MAKKLLFVSLLLVLVIASVDLVVDVSAQSGEMLQEVPGKTADALKTASAQSGEMLQEVPGKTADALKTAETTSVSWADWAKNKIQGLAGGGSNNDDVTSSGPSGSPASAPTPSVGA